MHGGASFLWQAAIGNGTPTAGAALTYFNNANAAIGSGNGTAVEDATHNNLQGASRLRKGMNSGYPQHTDGATAAARTIRYQATFGTADANWDWAELGLFNSATDAAGRMLTRKVQAMGAKTTAVSRVVTVELSYAA